MSIRVSGEETPVGQTVKTGWLNMIA